MSAPTIPMRFDDGPSPAAHYGQMVLVMAAVTAVGAALRPYFNPTDLAMLVLLGVVFVASRHGRGPAVVAAIVGIAAYDFLFVPPYYTFDVADKSYFVTFGVMLLVALTLSGLTATIRDQANEAQERAERTSAVFALSQELAGARARAALVSVAARHVGLASRGTASILLADQLTLEDGTPRWPAEPAFEDIAVRIAATYAWQHGEAAGSGTRHGAEAEALAVPLRTGSRTLGVMIVHPEPADRTVTASERATVQALADQTALALELAADAPPAPPVTRELSGSTT